MKQQERIVLFFIILLSAVAVIHAQSVSDAPAFEKAVLHVSADEIQKLLSGTALAAATKYPEKNRVRYMPLLAQFEKARAFVKRIEPTILYETLYFIPQTDYSGQSTIMATIFNYFRDVRRLPEIRYRNIQTGFIYPVFLSSYCTASLQDVKEAPQSAPLEKDFADAAEAQTVRDEIAVLQNMPPFGDLRFSYLYEYGANTMIFTALNNTPVLYSRIQAISPLGMLISAYIIRTDKGVLVYGIGLARITGIAVLFKKVITNSFESRMRGLFDWIKNEYEGLPQLQ